MFFGCGNFEATNSVFNIPDENGGFSIPTSGHWFSRKGAKTKKKLQNSEELRPQNDFILLAK